MQRDISGFDNLFQEGRRFIRQGCLQKYSRKGFQQRMFFLVNINIYICIAIYKLFYKLQLYKEFIFYCIVLGRITLYIPHSTTNTMFSCARSNSGKRNENPRRRQ